MAKVCLYLQIHQPWRLRKLSVFDVGSRQSYYSSSPEDENKKIIEKVSGKSYIPMLELLDSLTEENEAFKFSLSVSGIALEQISKYSPEVLSLLKRLSKKNQIEFLSETYYHSLASLYSPTEFLSQVWKHKAAINSFFGLEPKVFRNTELIYSNSIAEMVRLMGFEGMLAEGADRVLGGRSPSRLYKSPGGLPLLLKHYQLSDDIAFRFSQSSRSDKPLTAETFSHWINSSYGDDEVVNLFMDFETFGEHQWDDTGIFSFFKYFVKSLISSGGRFVTASEAIGKDYPIDVFDSVSPVSWADVDRDITAWCGNNLQSDSLKKVYELEAKIIECGDDSITEDWRKLQTSDHYYYMCTKWSNDGDVHAYFSPYGSPYNAYTNFNFAIADLKLRLNQNYG